MKILLRPNLDKKDGAYCTNMAVRKLAELGASLMLDNRFQPHIEQPQNCQFGIFGELLQACDIVLAIGGDGTMLHAVKHAVRVDKPVLGMNTGRVGFLTQMEGSELDTLALLVKGEYTLQERMLLELLVEDAEERHSVLALNDVVVTRHSHKLVELGVYSGERLVVRHRADGLIFATPTGSTGYSLSAGGAVVDPSISAVLLTAICPYSVYNSSLILPPDQTYTTCFEGDSLGGGAMEILADGEQVVRLERGGVVSVRCAGPRAKLVDLGQRDFYENLREKLNLRR